MAKLLKTTLKLKNKGNRTFKDWYEDNKEEFSKRRKNKYRTDLEYRLRIRERALAHYYRKKARKQRGKED